MAITNSFLSPAGVLNNEVFDKILPRPSPDYGDRNIMEELALVVQSASGVANAINQVGSIHGAWTGGTQFLSSFAQQIVRSNTQISETLGSISEAADRLSSVIGLVQDISFRINSITMGGMPTVFLRSTLENINFLPDSIRDFFIGQTNKFPYFQKVSEAIGGIFYNFVLADNAVNLVEQLQNDITNKNLSGLIRPGTYMKLFAEITNMVESGAGIIDNRFVRSLPQSCFGKVHVDYTEPLAHGYNLCTDVLQGKRIVETRNNVLSNLVGSFSDSIRRLDSYFPVVSSVKFQKEEVPVSVAGSTVIVDNFGNKIPTEKPGDFRNLGVTRNDILPT